MSDGWDVAAENADTIASLVQQLAADNELFQQEFRKWRTERESLLAEVAASNALIEKIARCEIPASNEFATRIQHWCHEFLARQEGLT